MYTCDMIIHVSFLFWIYIYVNMIHFDETHGFCWHVSNLRVGSPITNLHIYLMLSLLKILFFFVLQIPFYALSLSSLIMSFFRWASIHPSILGYLCLQCRENINFIHLTLASLIRGDSWNIYDSKKETHTYPHTFAYGADSPLPLFLFLFLFW